MDIVRQCYHYYYIQNVIVIMIYVKVKGTAIIKNDQCLINVYIKQLYIWVKWKIILCI